MANVKHFVTLGIGLSPGSVKYYVLHGLTPSTAVNLLDVDVTDALVYKVSVTDASRSSQVAEPI